MNNRRDGGGLRRVGPLPTNSYDDVDDIEFGATTSFNC